jgi:hypothetical protein
MLLGNWDPKKAWAEVKLTQVRLEMYGDMGLGDIMLEGDTESKTIEEFYKTGPCSCFFRNLIQNHRPHLFSHTRTCLSARLLHDAFVPRTSFAIISDDHIFTCTNSTTSSSIMFMIITVTNLIIIIITTVQTILFPFTCRI